MKYLINYLISRLRVGVVTGSLFFLSLNSFADSAASLIGGVANPASSSLKPINVSVKLVTPGDFLVSYLKNLNQFSADVSENLNTDSGGGINNTGHVWIERPNKFRYEINSPETQVFVSDGQNLYDYEPDLMQVVVRPLDQSISQTPLLLLSSGAVGLEKKFKISFLDSGDDHQFLLIPLAQDGLISQVILSFNQQNIPEKMQVSNSFGQVTELSFSKVIENQKLDQALFKFIAPKGVDILGA